MPPLTGRRLAVSIGALLLALLLSVAICASIGSSRYTLLDLVRLSVDEETARAMILRVRLPRILMAALAGAALGASGAVFQAVLRNPLADPYILGVSGGAALGAFAATALGLSAIAPILPVRETAAFLGAIATVAILFLLSSARGRPVSHPMLLIGVIMNTVYLALILLIETVVEFSRLHGVRLWMIGTIPIEDYGLIAALSVVLFLGVVGLALHGRDLNLMSAGEEAARSLGVTVERTRVVTVVLASLITAAVVSVAGPIGFVGLIVPHAARLLFGPDHRLLVPASAVIGAIFLIAADTVSRSVMAPTEIPVGVVTALCGGPFFLWLYRRRAGGGYFQ
ncbi:MAG TPA: iron ABC transporter permease [Candidatus Polarisedimenticolia bacterium]|nr:iron ABC transporter permease [Candidatus Polarisedimenticolia bacterium]